MIDGWETGRATNAPYKGDRMPFMTGGDWSVGLNARTSLDQADMLRLLGRRLQDTYKALVEEPLPEHLTDIIDKLPEDE